MTSSSGSVAVAPVGFAEGAAAPAGFEIVEDLGRAEALWRAFEVSGIGSPYQRFDWVRSYAQAFAGPEAFAPRVAIMRAANGAVMMLLPVAIKSRRGLRIAEGIGGKQANFHGPIVARDAVFPQTPSEQQAFLMRLGRALGADALAFENLPRVWRGKANPLAVASAKPAPSNAYGMTLAATAEDTLGRIGSSESRRKLRKKEAALGRHAPVTYRVARSVADVEAILEAFQRQKAERFAALGISNPFDDAAARDFLREGSLVGLGDDLPAIELHGLWLGERVVATYGGAVDGERFSCMFNSFDADPELARHSPGDLLLLRVIRAQCERGRTALDLGVGEARYKNAVCDETHELVDLFFPVSTKGRLYVAARESKTALKRRVKQTPWAWRSVLALRAARARLKR